MARIAAKVIGALLIVWGLAVGVLEMGFLSVISPSLSSHARGEEILSVVFFAVMIVTLGVGCWWAASGGLWHALQRFLLTPVLGENRALSEGWSVVVWWESRRVAYNVVVGVAGLLSGSIAVICASISESRGGEPVGMPDGIFIVVAAVLFGIAANVCYTGGWVVELVARQLLPVDRRAFAPIAFVGGLIFSIAVTFLPAVLALTYLIALLTGHVPRPVG